LAIAVVVELEEHARMRRPQRHGRVRAVGRQVLAVEFDHVCWHLLLESFMFFSEKAKSRLKVKTTILTDSAHL
jgi:lactam utilization protein B